MERYRLAPALDKQGYGVNAHCTAQPLTYRARNGTQGEQVASHDARERRAFRPVAVRLSSGGDYGLQQAIQRTICIIASGVDVGGVVDCLCPGLAVRYRGHDALDDVVH